MYILKIQKCRYFNRGIRLYLQCKTKELNHNIHHLAARGEAKHYVADLAVLVFTTIRELIQEFNAMLIESRNTHHHDAYSYLTVFVLDTVLMRFVEQFKCQVFEATKCGVTFQAIGECLRIALGYFNKLKWHGLSLGMHVMDRLFAVVVESLDIYFEDRITDTRFAVVHDPWTVQRVQLVSLHRLGHSNSRGSTRSSLTTSSQLKGVCKCHQSISGIMDFCPLAGNRSASY